VNKTAHIWFNKFHLKYVKNLFYFYIKIRRNFIPNPIFLCTNISGNSHKQIYLFTYLIYSLSLLTFVIFIISTLMLIIHIWRN